MRTLHKTLLTCALAGVAALAFLRRDADASTSPPAAAPAAIVAITPAVEIAFAPTHWAPAGVISRRDARVAGEQPGRVARIASVGQTVAAGDPVAVLDDTSLRLREREIEAESARIRSQLDMARLQETRYAALADAQSIARAQYDQVRADRDMLAQDHARVQAQLAQLRHQRGQMVVRAPFDGVVAEQYAQVGEYLVPGGAVVRVVDTGAREIRVRAPVEFATQLPPGTSVQVRDGDQTHMLRVSAQVPIGDEASRQMEVRINMDGRTWPVGTALEVGMPRAAPRTVVAVPRDAVVLRREGSYVLRIGDDSMAERLDVVTGEEIDGLVEVDGAVQPGENVVVRGGERIAPGQAVTIEPDATLAVR